MLDLKASNFNKWSSFRAMCGKFGLLPHIIGDAPPNRTDATWEQADCCVRSWIYGSITDTVLDLAMDGTDQTAKQLWVAIDNLFQANKAPRAIYLSHEFHLLTQGDLSIDDYCLRVKTAADALRDVDQPVPEPALVLNLLRGLNQPYSNTADNIAASDNLTFASARHQLLLKELRLKNKEKTTAASALVASSAASCGNSGCRSSGGGQQQPQQQQQQRPDQQQCRNRKNYGGKRSYNGGGSSFGNGGQQHRNQAGAGLPGAGPWIYFSPGTPQHGGTSGTGGN
jgi:hypothetical protein